MTAQVLATELSNIISESKKKNADLRSSAEKSSQELKALPQTSEAQLSADLRRRPNFASPFLSACRTGSVKLALPGVICLQRVIVSQGLAPERLREALDSLQECCRLSFDIQLKVLQSLPSLLQNYALYLEGDLQAKTIEICITLQQAKSLPISSTASATLQQVISSVFEQVEIEDGSNNDNSAFSELEIEGATVPIGSAAHDAYRILRDVCLLLEGQKSEFVRSSSVSQPFGLEVIESILTNHGELFDVHVEFSHLLRTRIMPLVTRLLSVRPNFGTTVRATRILSIVVREHLEVATDDIEISLGLLHHLLDADGPSSWRRALCMETFRIIYSFPNLVTTLYSLYDEQDGRRNIIQDNLSLFARLAAEKPALIGLGHQSSYPIGTPSARSASQEHVIIESSSVAGLISGDLGVTETNAPGISTHWSAMKPPCLEQLDKTEAPAIPETYVYSLVLTCLTALSDGLAKVILPLTASHASRAEARSKSETAKPQQMSGQEEMIHGRDRAFSDTRARNVPMNPRDLKDHQAHDVVETIAHMVDTCWPAILATSSTFLNAALDTDHYRALIRSVQRFTQLAGLLRLSTPRDALMTTLAKAAVPQHRRQMDAGASSTPSILSPRVGSGSGADSFFSATSLDSPIGKSHSRRDSLDLVSPSLSQRNLMCLRALVNIAIAIGSILDHSWSIVVETLQKADNVLARSPGNASAREHRSTAQTSEAEPNDSSQEQASLNNEIAAVESAITRLFTSTGDYPHNAFNSALKSLCSLLGEHEGGVSGTAQTPGTPMLSRRNTSLQTLSGHVSGQNRTLQFALAKIGDLARTNINRLCRDPDVCGWTLLLSRLCDVATESKFDSTARLMAADIRANIALGVTLATLGDNVEVREQVQLRALSCLEDETRILLDKVSNTYSTASSTDLDVHRSAIEAVKSILENCGDALVAGWRSVFVVINSAFTSAQSEMEEELDDTANGISTYGEDSRMTDAPLRPVSSKIARAAFDCVQLICSDFLSSLKQSRIVMLVDILSHFCRQTSDMNISLTTLTLFWNLSDHLQNDLKLTNDSERTSQASTISIDEAQIRQAAEEGSSSAMWMFLQHILTSVTEDNRTDVRIGATQTAFRILGNTAEKLDAELWEYISHGVILRLLQLNADHYAQYRIRDHPEAAKRGLHSASRTLFESLVEFWNGQRQHLIGLSCFAEIWRSLLSSISTHLTFDEAELQTLVFSSLSRILPDVPAMTREDYESAQGALKLWLNNMPGTAGSTTADADDKALSAYVHLGQRIYEILDTQLDGEAVRAIIGILEQVTKRCPLPSYTSDVDNPTELQSRVLSFTTKLKVETPGTRSVLLDLLSLCITLPYRKALEKEKEAQPSFVAFSRVAQTAFADIVVANSRDLDMFNSGALTTGLEALATAVEHRYTHLSQGKDPVWRNAAEAASKIIEKILPLERSEVKASVQNSIWNSIVRITRALREVVRDDLPANDVVISDETADLHNLSRLRSCMGICLEGQTSKRDRAVGLDDDVVEEKQRRSYVQSLFQASLFHEQNYVIGESPLQDLHKLRPGRVYDPPFHPRIRICYASLDELFAMVNAKLNPAPKSTTGPPSLADLANTHLILRCALPLKRYIADQPLRGKMPTPTSQRLELLYLLEKMKHLSSNELNKLFPLVGKASACARADAEVADAMQRVLARSYERLE